MAARTAAEAGTTLRRMLANGALTASPKSPRDMELLLLLAAARFEPGRAYREPEVNALLRSWLEQFCSPHGIDHVTFRRALVDARLLVRDTAGATYRASTDRIDASIDAGTRTLDPAQVMERVRAERDARKRARPA